MNTFQQVEKNGTTSSSSNRVTRHDPLRTKSGEKMVHRQIGNQALYNLHQNALLQPKLSLGQHNDFYEREADRIADQVMQMNSSGYAKVTPARKTIQPRCAECASGSALCPKCEDKGKIQRTALTETEIPQAQLNTPDEENEDSVIQTKSAEGQHKSSSIFPAKTGEIQNGGQPLPASVKNFFEPRFGRDFGSVKIHTSASAAAWAAGLRARAYTVGNHIVFGKGQFSPDTGSGKKLIAHELTHTLQQGAGRNLIQRKCDPAIVHSRTIPVFFPQEKNLMEVYLGKKEIKKGSKKFAAIGLVQQALVDLGYPMGTTGQNKEGVDRDFKDDTETAVTAFQTAESVTGFTPGVIDQTTLKCLDEIRSKRIVPEHQKGAIPENQFRIDEAFREKNPLKQDREEDLFFERGSAILDKTAKDKVKILLNPPLPVKKSIKGCQITLEGYISEDEKVDFGDKLANDRIQAVDKELAKQKHDDAGPDCTAPIPPLRTHTPLPGVSSGVSDYRKRRKVEVVPPGEVSTTAPCPPGAPTFRTLTAAEKTDLDDAINLAIGWMDTAIGKLSKDHAEGKPALTEYFGDPKHDSKVKNKMKKWRNHLDKTVRTKNRAGTKCNSDCRSAIAFNEDTGTKAMMTLCPSYFQTLKIHSSLSQQEEKRAFVVMHEAGHGSIETEDFAYGHFRQIEFLDDYFKLALKNTDSFTLMTLCLNGKGFCSAPSTGSNDTNPGNDLNALEKKKVRQGLGWLESWLVWSGQDTIGVFSTLDEARESGKGVIKTDGYYGDVYELMIKAFDFHRPGGDSAPTFREQTQAAAILHRLSLMEKTLFSKLEITKDTSSKPKTEWGAGNPGPKSKLTVNQGYLGLTSDRKRVELLLTEIIKATGSIDSSLYSAYQAYIKSLVKENWSNAPKP